MRALLVAMVLGFALALPAAHAACPAAGRITIVPKLPLAGASPPEAGASAGACLSTPFAQVDDHVIPRGTDNVTVHYHVDLGAGTPTMTVVLDGLGLVGATFTMQRVAEDLGTSHRYAMTTYVAVAPAVPGDTITATVFPPGPSESGTYRVV